MIEKIASLASDNAIWSMLLNDIAKPGANDHILHCQKHTCTKLASFVSDNAMLSLVLNGKAKSVVYLIRVLVTLRTC